MYFSKSPIFFNGLLIRHNTFYVFIKFLVGVVFEAFCIENAFRLFEMPSQAACVNDNTEHNTLTYT